jgi:hypothetical protein
MKPLTLPANASFSVLLAAEHGIERNQLNEVVRWFEKCPGPVTVRTIKRPVKLLLNDDGEVLWKTAFDTLQRLRAEHEVPNDGFVFLLTESPNENNWYAVQDPENMRNGFGQAGDFRWVTSAPTSVISTHYLLKSIFNALITETGLDWTALCHVNPRGCFFDLCAKKQQLNLKLRTADICGDCMQVFRDIGIPDSLLQQAVAIMEACRPLSLNTGPFRPSTLGFDRWPFPVAVTRHKVVQAANPLLKFLLLLDHFDSLIRYFYLARSVLDGATPSVEDRPSLGWWLEQLAQSLKGQHAYREVVAIAQKEKVVALRNERRGHGWMAANSDAYAQEAANLETIITRIEEEMTPFFDSHRLVIPRNAEPKGDAYVASGDELTGSHLLHPPFKVKLAADPLSVGLRHMNDVFVADPRLKKFHRMSPFIQSAICPTCLHSRILITDGGSRYIDVFMGHRVELP